MNAQKGGGQGFGPLTSIERPTVKRDIPRQPTDRAADTPADMTALTGIPEVLCHVGK